MDKDNFFVKTQIESNINAIESLANTGVFSAPALRVFAEPSFVSIILKMHDLLQKLNALGHRVDFKDDVENGDITDLISKVRNAICHLDSPENLLDKDAQIKFVFCMAYGKANLVQIGEKCAQSEYEDDIAFFYGEHRVYLKRHIFKLVHETKNVYERLYRSQ
ncbi:MAG: hypothetical protein WC813_03605 [Patescibacteria group bacterium]|jgi:hypothetical protein